MNNKQKLLIAKYENEVKRPKSSDLGVKSDTRAKLRALISKQILENSQTTRRKYSHSMVSSTVSDNYIKDLNAISALKKLQKERLIISRLGFAEKAYALDKQIEVMREKAKVVRKAEEEKLMTEMLETLHKKNERKQQRLDAVIKHSYELNAQQLHWQVLDWNEPAIKFYKKYPTNFDSEWINCKLSRSEMFNHLNKTK
jgi:hypothetical protein